MCLLYKKNERVWGVIVGIWSDPGEWVHTHHVNSIHTSATSNNFRGATDHGYSTTGDSAWVSI